MADNQPVKSVLSVLCSLPHWGREMKKGFNLKWGSGSRKMNKHTCLCAVAQQAERENVKIEHLPGADGADGAGFCCSARGRLSWVNPWDQKKRKVGEKGNRSFMSRFTWGILIFYALVT